MTVLVAPLFYQRSVTRSSVVLSPVIALSQRQKRRWRGSATRNRAHAIRDVLEGGKGGFGGRGLG